MNIDSTVTISISTYDKFIKDSERLEAVKDYLNSDGYKDTNVIIKILGLQKGE